MESKIKYRNSKMETTSSRINSIMMKMVILTIMTNTSKMITKTMIKGNTMTSNNGPTMISRINITITRTTMITTMITRITNNTTTIRIIIKATNNTKKINSRMWLVNNRSNENDFLLNIYLIEIKFG